MKNPDALLSVDELRSASGFFITRVAAEPALMTSAELCGIFDLWSQVAGKEQVRVEVVKRTENDEDFIRFLHSARSWIGADRTYRPLRASEIDRFLDFAKARRRADRIVKKMSHANPELRRLVEQVMISFEEGDQHPSRFACADDD